MYPPRTGPQHTQQAEPTRRAFLENTAAVTALSLLGSIPTAAGNGYADEPPWYRRVLRWGQTNITEADPVGYDVAWWRAYWRRTRTQGVIINAGGIVAYYPSKFPLHHRAEGLD